MGRRNRHAPPGFAHHVVNRANDRQTIFRYDFDYATFIELLCNGVRGSVPSSGGNSWLHSVS